MIFSSLRRRFIGPISRHYFDFFITPFSAYFRAFAFFQLSLFSAAITPFSSPSRHAASTGFQPLFNGDAF
jgi:hypothetical protein